MEDPLDLRVARRARAGEQEYGGAARPCRVELRAKLPRELARQVGGGQPEHEEVGLREQRASDAGEVPAARCELRRQHSPDDRDLERGELRVDSAEERVVGRVEAIPARDRDVVGHGDGGEERRAQRGVRDPTAERELRRPRLPREDLPEQRDLASGERREAEQALAEVVDEGLLGVLAVGAEVAVIAGADEQSLPIAVVAVAAIALGGRDTLRKAVQAVRSRRMTMSLLMTVAVIGAIAIGQWPEAAVVIWLFGVAELIEALSLERARYAIRSLVAELSPFTTEPVDFVRWVKADAVGANDYNPNSVAPPEMELLRLSIMADGYTQPIVTNVEDDDTITVVDGFHRNRVGKECEDVQARVKGYLPVVQIRTDRTDRGDRIASTIRHNRARGKHQVTAMADIVLELKRRNWSDTKIGKELGMDPDEVLRLAQITGLAEAFKDRDFSEAWEAVLDIDDESPEIIDGEA